MPIAGAGGSTVSGAQIVDESISNDDISPSAGIVHSKLSGVAASGANTDITSLEFLKVDTINVSSAEILALSTTGKVLVAAPGAGKVIQVEEITFSMTAGTAYANVGQSQLIYDTDTVNLMNATIPAAFLSSVTDVNYSRVGGANTGGNLVNKSVKWWTNWGSDPTTGTGTVKIFIKYRIITL